MVVISDASGVVQTAKTNGFGYYFFEGIQSGESYLVNVESKQYNFTSRMVNVNDEVVNLDFVANP